MFEELLSFHQAPWITGAEYYANHTFHLWKMDLWKGPSYPKEWFAGAWERKAIEIITSLIEQDGEVTTETFTNALRLATEEAEGAYS